MDAHHPNSTLKEFNISAKLTSWARIERELDKCILLCSNCHRETHAGYHPQYLDLETEGYDVYELDDEYDIGE